MKRTVIAAGVLTALVFGTVGYAWAANPGTVTVGAKVKPTFTLTVDAGSVDFAEVDAGTSASLTLSDNFHVKSNILWHLTVDESVTALSPFVTESNTAHSDAQYGKQGFTDFAATYKVDLTSESAYTDITPGTPLNVIYTYTVVQGS